MDDHMNDELHFHITPEPLDLEPEPPRVSPFLIRAGGVVWALGLMFVAFSGGYVSAVVYGGLAVGVFWLAWAGADRLQ